jgi:hypothetical protein
MLRNILTLLALTFTFTKIAFSAEYLIIGDSHSCGAFGSKLADLLTQPNNKVTLYCAVSSAPQHWLRGTNPTNQKCKTYSNSRPQFTDCNAGGKVPTLSSLLQSHVNATVVIALGTNSLLSSTADASYAQLSSQLNGRNCIWIGPPHLNPQQSKGFPKDRVQQLENNLSGFYNSLKTSVGNCRLVDSRTFTRAGTVGHNTTDGVHRTREAGIYWAIQALSTQRR